MNKIGRSVLTCGILLAIISWCGAAQADILTADILSIAYSGNTGTSGNWLQMDHYRVWEANRKIFLYPENWTEPETSGDPSAFFDGQVSAMMQNRNTTVKEAYRIWKDIGQIFIVPENLLMPVLPGDGLQPYAFCSDCLLSVDVLAADLFPGRNSYSEGYLFLTGGPVTPVPEPSFLAFFGVGLAGAAAVGRSAVIGAAVRGLRSLMQRTSKFP